MNSLMEADLASLDLLSRVVLLSIEKHGFRLEGIQRFWYGLESLDRFRADPQFKIRRIAED